MFYLDLNFYPNYYNIKNNLLDWFHFKKKIKKIKIGLILAISIILKVLVLGTDFNNTNIGNS